MTNTGTVIKPNSSPEAIPVRVIHFVSVMPLPGNGAAESVAIAAESHPTRARYELAYLPVMRHHRVTYHFAGNSQPARTVYIPEAAVKLWEAA